MELNVFVSEMKVDLFCNLVCMYTRYVRRRLAGLGGIFLESSEKKVKDRPIAFVFRCCCATTVYTIRCWATTTPYTTNAQCQPVYLSEIRFRSWYVHHNGYGSRAAIHHLINCLPLRHWISFYWQQSRPLSVVLLDYV